MNQDYPELQQFLAGYFNQDWVDDHENANDVIDFFISEADMDTLTKIQIELDKLILSKKTEEELENYLLKDIGCYYYYRNEWKDGKTWLRHIATTLNNSKPSKRN